MASAPFRPQLTNKLLRMEQMIHHPSRPLLVIDGDSFAHRAYHGLPKSIRRRGNRGGGAIVGFANFLLRLYESEQPRRISRVSLKNAEYLSPSEAVTALFRRDERRIPENR